MEADKIKPDGGEPGTGAGGEGANGSFKDP